MTEKEIKDLSKPPSGGETPRSVFEIILQYILSLSPLKRTICIISSILIFCLYSVWTVVLPDKAKTDIWDGIWNRKSTSGIVGDSPRPTAQTEQADVTIDKEGRWKAVVPVNENGVRLELPDGRKFECRDGDLVEIVVSGFVNIGRGATSPDGEPRYSDRSMDSPFKDKVGGLEMWIGSKSNNRYFVGSHFRAKVNHSGIPVLRVIESINGYNDGNNSGSFTAKIRKVN